MTSYATDQRDVGSNHRLGYGYSTTSERCAFPFSDWAWGEWTDHVLTREWPNVAVSSSRQTLIASRPTQLRLLHRKSHLVLVIGSDTTFESTNRPFILLPGPLTQYNLPLIYQ